MIAPEIIRILRELKPHARLLWWVSITGLLLAGCETITIMAVKSVVDLLTAPTDQFMPVLGVIAVISIFAGFFRFQHLSKMNYVGELVINGIRRQLQNKFMRLNLTFHNNYVAGSGGLISRILNDLNVIQHGLRMFADFFREPLKFFGLLGWLFYLDWKLTLMTLLVLPPLLWFLRQVSKTIKAQSQNAQEGLEVITSTIKESLDGVRIIQSFNLEKVMTDRFNEETGVYLKARKKFHERVELTSPVSEVMVTFVILGIAYHMNKSAQLNLATAGDLVGYLGALLGLSAPIKKIQESYVRIQETVIAARRVFQIVDEKSEVPQSAQPKPFPKDWKTIVYKNVSFKYHENWILRNVSLTIRRGEAVAFVGSSGSGKSTLVNLLERFFDPTEGQILIDEIPIQEIDLNELRSHVGLVTQDVFLFSDTVERNIWSGDFSKPNDRVVETATAANAHTFIERMGMGFQSRVGDRGNLLSGGEKQRISIARALFKDAPILILDEATSALDSKNEQEVQKGLDLLMIGRTALVIAHRLSTISKSDRIYVLKGGELIEQGSHTELLARNGEYAHLYQLQSL